MQPPPLRLLSVLRCSRSQSVSVRGRLETSQKSQMEVTRSPLPHLARPPTAPFFDQVVVVATTQVATQIARPPRLQPPPLRLLSMLRCSRSQSVSVRGRLETSQKSQMEITRSPCPVWRVHRQHIFDRVVVVVVATTQVATQVARPPRLQPPPLRLFSI